MLNNRQKINFSIIVIFILLIAGIYFFNFQEFSFVIFNIAIVLSINIFVIVLYEFWQEKSISLNSQEKLILETICTFFINEGFSKEETYKFVSPYFKSYSQKAVKNVIFSNKKSHKNYLSLYWKSRLVKLYVIFVMLDILKENNLRNKINEDKLINYSIFQNKKDFKFVDYYLTYTQGVNKKRAPLIQVWFSYKELGILPENNNLVFQKIISRTIKNNKDLLTQKVKLINEYQCLLNDNFSKYENNSILITKIIFILISIFSIITIPFFMIFTILFFIPSLNMKDNENQKSKFRVPDFFQILKAELIINFFNDRYNVGKERLIKYVSYYTKGLDRSDIYNIILQKNGVKTICKLINDYKFDNVLIDDVRRLINMPGIDKKSFIVLLFDIAAIDKYFSDKEDEYIFMVGKLLEIPKEDIINIRNEYLRKGIKEKKIEQKTYEKSYSKSSSSMYVFYSAKAYKILGVKKDASNNEIKKAYRSLVMKNHPDKFAMQGKDAMNRAEKKFQIITESYELIKRLRNIA